MSVIVSRNTVRNQVRVLRDVQPRRAKRGDASCGGSWRPRSSILSKTVAHLPGGGVYLGGTAAWGALSATSPPKPYYEIVPISDSSNFSSPFQQCKYNIEDALFPGICTVGNKSTYAFDRTASSSSLGNSTGRAHGLKQLETLLLPIPALAKSTETLHPSSFSGGGGQAKILPSLFFPNPPTKSTIHRGSSCDQRQVYSKACIPQTTVYQLCFSCQLRSMFFPVVVYFG